MRAARRWYASPAQCCQDANFPWSDLAALQQNGLAPMHIFSRGANVVLRGNCFHDLYPFAAWSFCAGQFHLYNRISSWRYGCACHDAHSCAFLHGMICYITGSNFACNAQTWRFSVSWPAIGAEQCKTIHSGVGERRNILLHYNILGQY